MSRLQKLQRLTDYLAGLNVGCRHGGDPIKPIMTTAQSDATSKLAHLSGLQVLVARPETHQSGNSDGCEDSLGTAIFVLEKGLGLDRNTEAENAQYAKLLTVAGQILSVISEETSDQWCKLVTGLSLSAVDVVPEASLFGGWAGYSIELTFE